MFLCETEWKEESGDLFLRVGKLFFFMSAVGKMKKDIIKRYFFHIGKKKKSENKIHIILPFQGRNCRKMEKDFY